MEMIQDVQPWAIQYPYWVVDKWDANGLWYFDRATDDLEEAQEFCKHWATLGGEYKIIKLNFEFIDVNP